MIDLHCHLLPGVDDGPNSLDESVEVARAAASEGVSVLAATPHVRHDYPTTAETMETLVGEVTAALAAAGIALRVVTGGELAIDFLPRIPADDLPRFGLGRSKSLLLEFPYVGWPFGFDEVVFRLRARGFRPIVAHPERNAEVQAEPALLQAAVATGALVQVTSGSLGGRLGRASQQTAIRLIERRLVHLVASDAHGFELRRYGLADALGAVDDPELRQWLAFAVPAAILADEALPERPHRQRKRRLFRRLR